MYTNTRKKKQKKHDVGFSVCQKKWKQGFFLSVLYAVFLKKIGIIPLLKLNCLSLHAYFYIMCNV